MKHYYKDPEPKNLGLITDFNTIAWPDLTFPKEHFIDDPDSNTETLENNMIYPPYKYTSTTPPLCIFLPSEQLMLKIMRMCIGIKDRSELVINWRDE